MFLYSIFEESSSTLLARNQHLRVPHRWKLIIFVIVWLSLLGFLLYFFLLRDFRLWFFYSWFLSFHLLLLLNFLGRGHLLQVESSFAYSFMLRKSVYKKLPSAFSTWLQNNRLILERVVLFCLRSLYLLLLRLLLWGRFFRFLYRWLILNLLFRFTLFFVWFLDFGENEFVWFCKFFWLLWRCLLYRWLLRDLILLLLLCSWL